MLIISACDSPNEYHESKQSDTIQHSEITNNGSFVVSISTENRSKPPIRQYHNWIILVTDQQLNPIYPSVISVKGGMPAHGHALPTKPSVTEYLGDGRYRLEGVKFNMAGKWILLVSINSQNVRDIAEFNLDVSH